LDLEALGKLEIREVACHRKLLGGAAACVAYQVAAVLADAVASSFDVKDEAPAVADPSAWKI
jgi:hypothetical protein